MLSRSAYLQFRYRVFRVWELPVESVLKAGIRVFPLAPISAVRQNDLPAVIERIKKRLVAEPDRATVGELWTATKVLLDLRYAASFVYQLLQGVRPLKWSATPLGFRSSLQSPLRSGSEPGSLRRVECRSVSLSQPWTGYNQSCVTPGCNAEANAMPVHDWTRVDAGIFHHFHLDWISETSRSLNRGLLPPDYYALSEQIAGGLGPDVLTLQRPSNGNPPPSDPTGGVAVATFPPQVQHRVRAEADEYAARANAVVIRHSSNHQVVAVVEIVSPGNKSNRHGIRAFVQKALEMLRGGIHLLLVDVFPPGPRDPRGIHPLIWEEIGEDDFTPPADRPLTLAAYSAGPIPEAFIETSAVGSPLPEMPLFLTPEVYISLPLETTYQAAFEGFPSYWRDVLEDNA